MVSVGGAYGHGVAHELDDRGVLEPLVVDGRQPIARIEDDVDEVVPRVRLGEPVWGGDLRPEPRVTQRVERPRHVFRFHEDIDVLRVARAPLH